MNQLFSIVVLMNILQRSFSIFFLSIFALRYFFETYTQSEQHNTKKPNARYRAQLEAKLTFNPTSDLRVQKEC